MTRFVARSALALIGIAAVAQPAIAQTISCAELKQLQDLGKNSFAEIDGGPDGLGTTRSTFQLSGSNDCYLDFKDTNYPSFTCTWRGYSSQQAAEAARLSLKNQVQACLPEGYRLREREMSSSYATGFSSTFRFGYLQPIIRIDRSTDRKYGKHSVRLTFQMDLYEE